MNKNKQSKPAQKSGTTQSAAPERKVRKPFLLSASLAFFVFIWAWAAVYYGDVFHVARNNSFWSFETYQMQYILCMPLGWLWYVGRMLLQLFAHPWLGGLVLAAMLSVGSWAVNYSLRIPAKYRWAGFLPALAFIAIVSYQGMNLYYEAETGRILGIPALVCGILCIVALLVRIFGKSQTPALLCSPKDETPRQNRTQILVCLLGIGLSMAFVEWQRPYVRVVDKMMLQNDNQDWTGTQETARKHASLSNRPMAANYAFSLLHTDKQCERLYDIRMDYDSLYLFGWDGRHNNASLMYTADGNYHAGMVQSAYHTCMEQTVMCGPMVHQLELMIKCALMKGEWNLAKKYLHILRSVPFEGDFCEKYAAMVKNHSLVESDPEMAHIRLTEPMHDSFEAAYQQPVFLGYNLKLYEGRSINALWNSLAVCLYTKLMPDFLARIQPLQGSMPPENVADGILLNMSKHPELEKMFTGMDIRKGRINGYLNAVQPFMKDRPGNARKLFDKYKGYYPYYYFFGNLKATKKTNTNTSASSSGVN